MLTAVHKTEFYSLTDLEATSPQSGVRRAELIPLEALGENLFLAAFGFWGLPATLTCGHISPIFELSSHLCVL